jgi:hypothetical protein
MTEVQFMESLKTPLPPAPADVIWKSTYCHFEGGKFFCEWEAPKKEMVEERFKQINMPFDVVYPVRLFDAIKMEMEPAPQTSAV